MIARLRSSPVLTTIVLLLLTPGLAACQSDDQATDPGPDPETPGGTAALANECAAPGAGWIWCDDFNTDRTASYFEYSRDGFTRASGVGMEGTPGMEARFNAGQVGAGNLKLAFGRTPYSYFRPADAGTEKYRDVYWRVFVRYQPGWRGGGGAKFSRATVFSGSNWSQAAIAHVWSGGEGANYLVLDPASGTDAAGNLKTTKYNDFDNLRWLGVRRGVTPLFDPGHVGEWYCVEAHMKLNDPGQANGVFEFWIDGNREAGSTTLNWLGTYDAYGINAVFLENFWNDGSPTAQTRWFDNFVVSRQRIGCGAGA
jgi:hypothetical protein